MNYAQQKITIPEAEEILFDLYNIRGTASPLPGYVDFNFRIKIYAYIINAQIIQAS